MLLQNNVANGMDLNEIIEVWNFEWQKARKAVSRRPSYESLSFEVFMSLI